MGKTLIIGAGEIGNSLLEVLQPYYDVWIKDKDPLELDDVDMMFICFPYSEHFEAQVREYQKEYKPKHTVVFSTTPPRTCQRLKVIHSPVEGMHPYLADSIRYSIRFLAGNPKELPAVANYFRRANLKVYVFDDAQTTEVLKIMSTTKFGVDIEYENEVKHQCKRFGVPYEAWTIYNQNYNRFYEELGYPEYKRPILTPIKGKRIGGHCVLPNCKLLDTRFTRLLKELNK